MVIPRYICPALLLLLFCHSGPAFGQALEGFAGQWVINEELSDNTDKQVETALRAAGEKVKRKLFDFRKDRYRGGPPEQELYDRISYDNELTINLDSDTYLFTYADEFSRPVYTDNRSRSVSLTSLDEVEDFSFAHWEDGKLLVEARPRDGGFADETYTLVSDGARLQVDLYIKPKNFQVPVEIRRVYDRKP
jgi:hypothetical protein